MKARLIKGKPLAESILRRVKTRAAAVERRRRRPVRLAMVALGRDPAGESYMRAKIKACSEAGIRTSVFILPAKAGQAAIIRRLKEIGRDREIDALILERPLPKGIPLSAVLGALTPAKDAEGLTSENFGQLMLTRSYEGIQRDRLIVPCAAMASVLLLLESRAKVSGRRAVVVGRSNVLGKPAAHLLTSLDATVTVAHSRTRDLKPLLKQADIVLACMGKPRYIKGSWLKSGATVIDAGINWDKRGLCGDVDFASASRTAGRITPVPGGVGPVTTALLLSNTVLLAEKRL